MKPWRSLFLIAPDCHASAGHYTSLWRRHFYEGFEGCEVRTTTPADISFDFARVETPSSQTSSQFALANSRLREQIIQAAERQGVDAVISYARDTEVDPALVRDITERGIPWVSFFCDSVGQFAAVRGIAAAASLNWFPEALATEDYRRLGRPILCRPYVLNANWLAKTAGEPGSPARFPVGFVGLPSSNRLTILSILRGLGCPVEIRGHGWDQAKSAAFGGHESWQQKLTRLLFEPHRLERIWRRVAWRQLRRVAGGPLKDDELIPFLRDCQLVLGLNETRAPDGRLVSYLKFRDVEMPGYGLCYLTQDNPDIASALTPGKEVLTFRSVWEARSKIRFYRRRPEACRRIGAEAAARVRQEHTWRTRLAEMQRVLA